MISGSPGAAEIRVQGDGVADPAPLEIVERQREQVVRAYREAGPVAVEGFRRVMRGLMGPDARAQLERLEQASPAPGPGPSSGRNG